MEKRYEKDPINGKWYEVKEEGFTDSEWQEFQERWGQVAKPQRLEISKAQIFVMIIILLAIEAKLLGVW